MADRYCRNCGQELRPEEWFCTSCGRGVYETAHVPTPEADVPVPPPPQPAGEGPKPSGSAAQPAATQSAPPSSPSQPQQGPVGRRQQLKRPILWFLASVVVAGLLGASMAPRILYLGSGFTSYALDQMLIRLIIFVPLWLFLGGFFFLFARLLGKKPSLLQVIFGRWLTIVVVILVLLSGLSYF